MICVPYLHLGTVSLWTSILWSHRSFVEPQISHFRKFHTVKNWYKILIAQSHNILFRTIFLHFLKKNTHEVKFLIAYMRISHIDKIPSNLLNFAFDSNSSQFFHWHLWWLSTSSSRLCKFDSNCHMCEDLVPVPYTYEFWYQLGDNCIQVFIWGGISSDIRSEIEFYGDARAEP